MFEKQQWLEIQMELERQKQKAAALKRGSTPRRSKDPDAGDPSSVAFWRLVAAMGCQLVGRGYRLRARRWPVPSALGDLLVHAGIKLRRRALVIAKTAPCI